MMMMALSRIDIAGFFFIVEFLLVALECLNSGGWVRYDEI